MSGDCSTARTKSCPVNFAQKNYRYICQKSPTAKHPLPASRWRRPDRHDSKSKSPQRLAIHGLGHRGGNTAHSKDRLPPVTTHYFSHKKVSAACHFCPRAALTFPFFPRAARFLPPSASLVEAGSPRRPADAARRGQGHRRDLVRHLSDARVFLRHPPQERPAAQERTIHEPPVGNALRGVPHAAA